jgi:hypothetical protein
MQRGCVVMPILEILTSSTAATVAKFLIEKVVEYKKSKGTDKEVEILKDQLETYREKTNLLEKELEQFKEIAGKLETKLGSSYISENAYVNWGLDTIKPKASAFKIEVWTEKGDFHGARDITVIPRTNTYKIGDKINLYFRAEKECYLTLINYGTSGKLTVLLPNALSQDNFIKRGRIYAIPGEDYPFDYILSGPPGTERLKAIATTRRISLMDVAYDEGEVFHTSSAAARDISVVAKNIQSAAPNEWAEALCEFEVR